jgi:apolipoprotein N-acyltransferase
MPPWGWWPCAFVGLAIFERLLAGQPRRTRFIRGFTVGLWWLFPATLWMWDLTPPGYLIQGLMYSAMYGVGAMLVPPDRGRRIAFPALFVLVALLRWNWPFGGVPLATLAMTQADGPLGPTARLFTTLTIVALVPIVGVALSAATQRQWKSAGIAIGVVLGAWLLALVAPSGEAIDTRDIAIVQGGGPQNTRAINSDARKVFERHREATGGVEGPVDFVFWPENAITTNGPFTDSQEYAEITELARRLDAPMIVGVFESFRLERLEADGFDVDADLAPVASDRGFNLNAQVTVMPDGTVLDRYDKLRLVPFGETVPLRWLIEPFAPAALPTRDARAGAGPAVLDTGTGATAAVSISWEIFHDDRAHDGMRNGGEILLNPTNGASYWLTILQTQQVASSQLRAMETGRYVLQAAPTGFSAIVEPDGTVIDRSGVSEAKVIQGTIELRTGNTWSTVLGPWPAMLVAFAAMGLAWGRARSEPGDEDSSTTSVAA